MPIAAPDIRIQPHIMMKSCVPANAFVQNNGDIIINAGINSGSEVIASGQYSYLWQRSWPGHCRCGWRTSQHVFSVIALEAELISIAGTYCVADDIPAQYLKDPCIFT